MSKLHTKTTYLLTFNVNIYAETRGSNSESMYDHNGCSIVQYMKGETLEISEESFMLFIEYGRCSNLTTTPITGIPCTTTFTTSCIDNVSRKIESIQIQDFVNTAKRGTGIDDYAATLGALQLVENFKNKENKLKTELI